MQSFEEGAGGEEGEQKIDAKDAKFDFEGGESAAVEGRRGAAIEVIRRRDSEQGETPHGLDAEETELPGAGNEPSVAGGFEDEILNARRGEVFVEQLFENLVEIGGEVVEDDAALAEQDTRGKCGLLGDVIAAGGPPDVEAEGVA